MISISNADRDKAIDFLKAYASLLQENGVCTTKTLNERRMALNLAKKLSRKAVESKPDRKQTLPQK